MKGICGELRKFRCRDCRLVISKYFSHFERPQSFRVVECDHCHGKSDLIEQEVDLKWASEASVPTSRFGLRTESVDWVFKH
jgi:Zn finger protein HypA/HybF involved in hydrogenase expression